jgi:hypothetical protein
MNRGVFLAMALAGAAAAAATDARHFRTHPFAFADPAVVEPAAQMIVGSGGRVLVDRQSRRLLVFATEDEHDKVRSLLRALDVPPRNVQIDVEFADAVDRRETGGGIAAGGRQRADGSREAWVASSFRHARDRESGLTVQTITVASGRQAQLSVGRRVPYLEWLMDYGRRCGALRQVVQWEDVGSYLVVEPEVIGDGPDIRIRLTPMLSGTADGRPLELRYAAAATDVFVRDGQTISIGGLDQDRQFYSMFLVGAGAAAETRRLDIRLTPHIVTPAGPAAP